MASSGMQTILYPVRDLAAAKKQFTELLGVDPEMDQPYYVQFKVGDQAIGLDPKGHNKGMTGATGYYHVDDLDARVKAILDAGGTTQQEIREVGPGRRVAAVTDADGNVIGLLQDGE